MKVDVELEPFTPLLRPTYADAHAGAISEVRMEGYEFGHTYVCKGPGPGRGGETLGGVQVPGLYRRWARGVPAPGLAQRLLRLRRS